MPYTTLAEIYDEVMSHVNYYDWIALIHKIIKNYLTTSPDSLSILELGAGTGNLRQQSEFPAAAHYYATDICYEMCAEAGKKGLSPMICVDAKHPCFKPSQFDLVLFLYDGINYLRNKEEYVQLFNEVARLLPSKGYFLFDITTQFNSISNFSDSFDFEDLERAFFLRHSYYDPQLLIQYNDFTIFKKRYDGLFEKLRELHQQVVFDYKEIKRWIPSDVFSIRGIWDGFGFSPANRRSTRIHFLLQKV